MQSPAAYTPRAEVRETRSTLTKPPSSRITPASSRPRSAVLGTEPRARMQCEPSTVRPSVSVTVTHVAGAGHRLHPGLGQHVHPAPGEHVLEHLGGVGVLAGQHPVAGGDQGDLDAEGEVGAGELRAGDAGADHDQLGRHLVEVVDLLPGEDPLAVGLRRRQRAGRGAGRDQDRVGAQICSEPSASSATTRCGPSGGRGPGRRGRPREAAAPDVARLVGGELLDPDVDPPEVDPDAVLPTIDAELVAPATSVISSAVAMRVLLGTQSVRTAEPPRPSRSTTTRRRRLGRDQRGLVAAGAATDDDDVVGHARAFRG